MRHDGTRYWIIVNKKTNEPWYDEDPTGYKEILKLRMDEFTEQQAQNVLNDICDEFDLNQEEWKLDTYRDF